MTAALTTRHYDSSLDHSSQVINKCLLVHQAQEVLHSLESLLQPSHSPIHQVQLLSQHLALVPGRPLRQSSPLHYHAPVAPRRRPRPSCSTRPINVYIIYVHMYTQNPTCAARHICRSSRISISTHAWQQSHAALQTEAAVTQSSSDIKTSDACEPLAPCRLGRADARVGRRGERLQVREGCWVG